MGSALYTNNAVATLSAGINNSTTTITLTGGQGALFPNPTAGNYFYATLVDAATQLVLEIVKCTARSTDTLTVVRAQQGTSAQSYLANDRLELRPTAYGFAELTPLSLVSVPMSTNFGGL